jgi:hypothetical protein
MLWIRKKNLSIWTRLPREGVAVVLQSSVETHPELFIQLINVTGARDTHMNKAVSSSKRASMYVLTKGNCIV